MNWYKASFQDDSNNLQDEHVDLNVCLGAVMKSAIFTKLVLHINP
jgi:hypothetical protein